LILQLLLMLLLVGWGVMLAYRCLPALNLDHLGLKRSRSQPHVQLPVGGVGVLQLALPFFLLVWL
jgi:hypothetical protein